MTTNYLWTDNPTEANIAVYDPDILNECLMHLKYTDTKLTNFCVNSASVDSNGKPNLLSYTGNTVKFNCGNALHPVMTSNSQDGWTLFGSHQITSSSNDLYKSFDNTDSIYCALSHTPSLEEPAYITIEKNTNFSFDFLYLKFKTLLNPGDIKSFSVTDENDEILYSYDNFDDYLDKDEFLIPVFDFYGTKIKISAASNVNDATYVNFPCIIKLLDKKQVVTLTDTKGNKGKIVNLSDLTIPSTANATFNIFSDTKGNIEAYSTSLTKDIVLPSSPSVNQIHLLTCSEPLCAKKYNGTIWEDYNKVPVGCAKTNSSGNISEVSTFDYNQNGHNVNKNTQGALTKVWISNEYTPIANTPTIVNHNLNLANPLYAKGEVFLKCAVAEYGYSVGDYAMSIGNVYTSTPMTGPLTPVINTNSIQVNTGMYTSSFIATRKDTGVAVSLTPANWRYVFRIFY